VYPQTPGRFVKERRPYIWDILIVRTTTVLVAVPTTITTHNGRGIMHLATPVIGQDGSLS
jgi:hypothetical protein